MDPRHPHRRRAHQRRRPSHDPPRTPALARRFQLGDAESTNGTSCPPVPDTSDPKSIFDVTDVYAGSSDFDFVESTTAAIAESGVAWARRENKGTMLRRQGGESPAARARASPWSKIHQPWPAGARRRTRTGKAQALTGGPDPWMRGALAKILN